MFETSSSIEFIILSLTVIIIFFKFTTLNIYKIKIVSTQLYQMKYNLTLFVLEKKV